MAFDRLNKRLWTEITRLKLLAEGEPKFILEKSPFDGISDEEEPPAATPKSEDMVIIGRIFPNSQIYKECSYRIEMKLTSLYPVDPPEVRFLTPIYHPSVAPDGKISSEIITRVHEWRYTNPLMFVVQTVVEHIDYPDICYSISANMGREYMENKSEFDRKAMECARKYGLPRS